MFLAGAFICYWAEQRGNPMLTKMGLEHVYTGSQPGGNMEGKEVRFGIAQSTLFATVTTDASCGAVNGMHDSFTPIGGLVPLFNIQTDEVIFGGVGAGLYSMLIYAVVAVFIGGLMVGRTPEYVGKKIEQKEVKMAIIAILATSLGILGFTALSSVAPFAKGGYWNPPGPAAANTNNNAAHGFSEILYAYSSGAGNNGSAFAGINANTPWYNLTIGLDMLVGRFLFIIPALGHCGKPGHEETRSRHQRHVANQRDAICRPADRDRDHCGSAYLFPGALARSDRRAFSDAERKIVLMLLENEELEMSTVTAPPVDRKPEIKEARRHDTHLAGVCELARCSILRF